MTKPTPEKGNTAQPSNPLQDDYSIYPDRDHVTQDAVPFILGDYGDDGVFSDQQISDLAERHDLTEEHLRELSQLIGYSLDIDAYANLITITRSKIQSRLNSGKLPTVHDDHSFDVKEANALFESLGLEVSVVYDPFDVIRNDSSDKIEADPTVKKRVIGLDEALRILQPDDRRRERDGRRLLVAESCSYIALDAGWPITYTTDSTALKNQRGGRLIALIKDVIRMTSRDEYVASVHTLKTDIEMVRRRFKRRGEQPTRTGT